MAGAHEERGTCDWGTDRGGVDEFPAGLLGAAEKRIGSATDSQPLGRGRLEQ